MHALRGTSGTISIAAALVAGEWIAVGSLVGFSVQAFALAAAITILVLAAGIALGGVGIGTLAALFWVVAPTALGYWRSDYRPHWRHELLPVLYGAHNPARALAGIVLLGGFIAALRAPSRLRIVSAAIAVVAAGALVRADRGTIAFHWHAFVLELSSFREVGWSLRLIEYLAVAGAVGAIMRFSWRGCLLVAWFAIGVVLPLGNHPLMPTADPGPAVSTLETIVSSLPAYALLVGCIVSLVPRPALARLRLPARTSRA